MSLHDGQRPADVQRTVGDNSEAREGRANGFPAGGRRGRCGSR